MTAYQVGAVAVFCNQGECNHEITLPVATIEEGRKKAVAVGWSYDRDGGDRCPDHPVPGVDGMRVFRNREGVLAYHWPGHAQPPGLITVPDIGALDAAILFPPEGDANEWTELVPRDAHTAHPHGSLDRAARDVAKAWGLMEEEDKGAMSGMYPHLAAALYRLSIDRRRLERGEEPASPGGVRTRAEGDLEAAALDLARMMNGLSGRFLSMFAGDYPNLSAKLSRVRVAAGAVEAERG